MKILKSNNETKKKILIALEELVNEDEFFGVPMGGTLASVYYLQLYLNHWMPKNAILDFLRYVKYRYFFQKIQAKKGYAIEPHLKKRILLTLVGERNELVNLVRPLTENFKKSGILLFLAEKNFDKYFDKDISSISWEDIPFDFDKTWFKEYKRVSKSWHKKIIKFLINEKVSVLIFWTLAFNLLIQSNRVYILENLLSKINPSLVLTEFDRNYLSAPIVLVAKQKNIPTVTMMHGVINPPYGGCLPLLADHIFCWGEHQRELLISENVDPKKIVITGNQRFIQNKENVFADPDLPLKSPPNLTITLGTAPVSKEDRRKIAIEFGESIRLLAKEIIIKGIIRLHPSENLSFYRKIQKAYPEIHFSTNIEFSLDEIFDISDIIVVNDSGFGNDAILQNKIVIIFNPTTFELGNGKELILKANCPIARDSNELNNIVLNVLNNREYSRTLLKGLKSYQDYFCSAFGQNAANNVVNAALKIRNLENKGS